MKLRLFLSIVLSSAVILSACGSGTPSTTAASTAPSMTTAPEVTQTTQPPSSTSAPATTPATTPAVTTTPAASGFKYEKLGALTSYRLILTAEAMAGMAANVINKYGASHLPAEKAYQAALSVSRDGGEFIFAEEAIVIGKDLWVKDYKKIWTTGTYTIANAYETYLNLLYLGLKNGQLTKIDEAVLGGVPAVHYSLLYETKSALLKGEVWIANQEGLPPVPLKADTEQMALDEAGAVLDDYRHIKINFEVSDVNGAITITPPI